MAWKKFDPLENARNATSAMASINKNGILYLNPSAAAFLKGRPSDFAELYFDGVKKRLGIKPVVDSTPTSYSLSTVPGKEYRKVTVARLFHSMGVEITETLRYRADWNAKQEMVVVDLRQPLPVTAQEKARRQPRKKRLKPSPAEEALLDDFGEGEEP